LTLSFAVGKVISKKKMSSPSSLQNGSTTKVPTVLYWGSSTLMAVHRSPQRDVYYPDGMKLEIKLTPDIVLIETIRVVVPVVGGGSAAHAEHMFQLGSTASDYHRVRLQAFQQCLARVAGRKVTPPHRAVIFGVSHQTIQDGIQQRMPTTMMKKKKKQVRWGDHVIEEDEEEKIYGGWGLEKVFEIPNRYQLRSVMCDENEQEEDDFELEDDLEILSPDEDEEEEQDETMGVPEQELVDESAESEDDENDIQEEEVEPINNKRIRLGSDDDMPATPPPVTLENDSMCAQVVTPSSLEDEIKQFDMWLLQNDVVI